MKKFKRIIYASQETEFEASRSKLHAVKVYSFFPVDRADCLCKAEIFAWNQKIGKASKEEREAIFKSKPSIQCPAINTSKMQRYEIICRECNETQGFCWASTPDLIDWVDFHYVQWTKGDFWRGCFTPHISPVTQELCFECACGNDTRDFRANMTLSQKVAEAREADNAVGRKFNRPDSKFLVKRVS